MPPSKIRFVTLCQQLLALAVVVAALIPAASVVSLDVVQQVPVTGVRGAQQAAGTSAELSAYVRAVSTPSKVPEAAVDPVVEEYPLTAPSVGAARSRTAAPAEASSVTSAPEDVSGYGAVGVTWAHEDTVAEDQITVRVRTREDDTWSGWMDLEYHDDHGPDPGSVEARHARPGTDALLVGDVDEVQVQADVTTGELPADMKLAVIDPGEAAQSAVEKPALDTGTMDGDAAPDPAADPGADTVATEPGSGTDATDQIELQAATYTPKPKIYSRAQWGADERMRDRSSLHYFEVHAGFVHHTVNANSYTRAEVPGIIRSIYAYHTKSRGWSDIGYNFLVDRFGRIWEGRAGGIDRPVVGAHTLGYNDDSFAMSAIGNYDIKQPSSAMIEAYGALFAWKLSLHGVDASSKSQWVTSRSFQAINGHRDAGSTACPGRYLYAKIPQIRTLAAAAQNGWAGRELQSNLASTVHPDVVARRASDGRAVIIPTGGLTDFGPAARVSTGWASNQRAILSPDLTGDGRSDVVEVGTNGTGKVRPGSSTGAFGAATRTIHRLTGRDLAAAVGDLNGDGRNDLVARAPNKGRLDVLLGRPSGGFKVAYLTTGWSGYNLLVGAGDLTSDGHRDLLARSKDGTMWLFKGTGRATFGSRVELAGSWNQFSGIVGGGDYTGDGRADLFVRSASSKAGYVLPSKGDGTFAHSRGPLLSFRTVDSLVGGGQVAGDGTPDVLARYGSTLRVKVNRGTTETRRSIVTNVRLSSVNTILNVGDWDRDGHGDLVGRSAKSGRLYLWRGNGAGRFESARRIGSGFGSVGLLAAVGDMTGDGYPDLMGQPRNGAMRIYPGRGLSGLGSSYVAHRAINAYRQVGVGRWNSDGAPDSILLKGGRPTLYPGNGPGGLTGGKALDLDLSRYDWVLGVSAIDLRGHPDLVVRERATDLLFLIPGTTNGFGPRRFLAEGLGGYDLAG